MEFESQATTEEWERRIGSEIPRLRVRERLTQADLAERANVSMSAVKYLEGGKGSSLATLIRVVRGLGRSDWLASLMPTEPAVSPMAMLKEQNRRASMEGTRVRRRRADFEVMSHPDERRRGFSRRG